MMHRQYYGNGIGRRNTSYRKEKAITQYLYRIFGRSMWHSYVIPKNRFKPGKPCYCCHVNPSTRRIWVNIWGTCYPVNVCEDHKRFHGLNMEEIPDCLPLIEQLRK